jgi:hypothetical protein
VDGWVCRWVSGWVEVKAVLRITYSNQKYSIEKNEINLTNISQEIALLKHFLTQIIMN